MLHIYLRLSLFQHLFIDELSTVETSLVAHTYTNNTYLKKAIEPYNFMKICKINVN